jgi:hypothetical protein
VGFRYINTKENTTNRKVMNLNGRLFEGDGEALGDKGQ